MKSNREFTLRKPTALQKAFDRIVFWGKYSKKHLPAINTVQQKIIEELRLNGTVVIEDFIDDEILTLMIGELNSALENLEFDTPCLAQSLLNEAKHHKLIQDHLYATVDELTRQNVTFDKSEVTDYDQVVNVFKPSTLTVKMLMHSQTYRKIWLDPFLLSVVTEYLGMRPNLSEAYVRRNFPAKYRSMNHYWHRDLNSRNMLKAFVFLSDCDLENGPHEYIRGTHLDFEKFNGKRYFDDDEIDRIYPPGHPDRYTSIIKKGSIIIEDTRGLHRAAVPNQGYRDLGYMVFTPLRTFYPHSNFNFPKTDLQGLSEFQKAFIHPNFLSS